MRSPQLCAGLSTDTEDNKIKALTSGMTLTKLNKKALKSFDERPIIALQSTTCTETSRYWLIISGTDGSYSHQSNSVLGLEYIDLSASHANVLRLAEAKCCLARRRT